MFEWLKNRYAPWANIVPDFSNPTNIPEMGESPFKKYQTPAPTPLGQPTPAPRFSNLLNSVQPRIQNTTLTEPTVAPVEKTRYNTSLWDVINNREPKSKWWSLIKSLLAGLSTGWTPSILLGTTEERQPMTFGKQPTSLNEQIETAKREEAYKNMNFKEKLDFMEKWWPKLDQLQPKTKPIEYTPADELDISALWDPHFGTDLAKWVGALWWMLLDIFIMKKTSPSTVEAVNTASNLLSKTAIW
jgi:hypothetical protein